MTAAGQGDGGEPGKRDLRPLAGYRIVDLAVAWAGPFGLMLLGDLGAEVIKVENIHVWQPHTRNWRARPRREDLEGAHPLISGHPDGDPGERPWERSPSYVPVFRNKKSVTMNLKNPRGMDYLRRLVAVSDVIYDNNVPETLDGLGITWEAVREWNPRIIMFRAPAFGLTGAYRNYRAWGNHIEAVLGHTLLRGYPDMDPSTNTPVFAGDYQTGVIGAFAVMAALFYRERTGKGQLIDMSQAENGIHLFVQSVMDWALNRRIQHTTGNRGVHGEAPSGVYRCAGEDRWVAIDVCEDAEWRALASAMGRPELGGDPRFATAAARRERMDELDALVGEWTRPREAHALMLELQARRVPAGEVQDAAQAYHCPHLRARRFFERVEHRFTGTYDFPGMMFKMPASDLRIAIPPSGLGEYNEYVYRQVLGVSDAGYDELVTSGEIGTVYDEDIT